MSGTSEFVFGYVSGKGDIVPPDDPSPDLSASTSCDNTPPHHLNNMARGAVTFTLVAGLGWESFHAPPLPETADRTTRLRLEKELYVPPDHDHRETREGPTKWQHIVAASGVMTPSLGTVGFSLPVQVNASAMSGEPAVCAGCNSRWESFDGGLTIYCRRCFVVPDPSAKRWSWKDPSFGCSDGRRR